MRLFSKMKARSLYGALFEKAALQIISGKFVVLLFVFFQLLFLAFISLGWSIFKQTELENRITQDRHVMSNIGSMASSEFFQLGEVSFELKNLTEDLLAQGLGENEIKERLGQEFLFLAKVKSFYDQIRLFDAKGVEAVRVENRHYKQDLIASADLEDKSDRPYFERAFSLEPGQFYISQPAPMTENGVIIQPLRTVVQAFFPVQNPRTGERYGYININLDTDPLFGEFQAHLAEAHGGVSIVSSDGSWMYSKNPGKEFENFMGRGLSFRNMFPEIWTRASAGISGEFPIRGSTVVFRKIEVIPRLTIPNFRPVELSINPDNQKFKEEFYLISVVEPPALATLFKEAPLTVFIVWGTYIVFTLMLSFYIAYLVATRTAMKERTRHSLKMEAVGELTGGVAHDFNNLLTAVIGNLNLLERENPSEREQKMISQALKAAWRGAELTKRLLAFSRKQNLAPKRLDLCQVLEDTKPLIVTTIGEGIIFTLETPKKELLTSIDPLEYQNVVLNLAINARDAMKGGGKLKISVYSDTFQSETAKAMEVAPGPYIVTKITDTGEGMTLEVQKQAIDPFFTTKPVGEGSGLGLSMAYGFAKQSGGELKIISEVGKGTTILILLPEDPGGKET